MLCYLANLVRTSLLQLPDQNLVLNSSTTVGIHLISQKSVQFLQDTTRWKIDRSLLVKRRIALLQNEALDFARRLTAPLESTGTSLSAYKARNSKDGHTVSTSTAANVNKLLQTIKSSEFHANSDSLAAVLRALEALAQIFNDAANNKPQLFKSHTSFAKRSSFHKSKSLQSMSSDSLME